MIIDAAIENIRHLPEVLRVPGVDGVILPGDRLAPERWKNISHEVQQAGKKAYFAFPYVMRTETEAYYREHQTELAEAGFDGFLVRSLDAAGFLLETGIPGIRIFDQGMYTWNRRAVSQMKLLGADILTLPYECRREELEARGFEDSEMLIYGRMPVMISAQCTRKTNGRCRLASGIRRDAAASMTEFIPLRDRKKAEFPEDSHCRFCYSVIYNSVPLWLVDRVPAACERVRFSFTDEAEGVPESILRSCLETVGDDVLLKHREPMGAFTRGHLKRGVE